MNLIVRRAAVAAAVAVLASSNARGVLTFSVTGTWDTQARKDAATAAMQAVVNRYNAYGNFTQGNDGDINVIYNSGVATADSTYNGTIRFGGTYPNERVAQHESNHWLGSGTTSNWTNLFTNGIWTGAKMNALVAQFDGDGTVIHQSGVHFYGYGLNYDTEVVNGSILERNIALEYAQRQDDGLGVKADPWTATTVTLTHSDPVGRSAFNYLSSNYLNDPTQSVWDDNYFAHPNAAYFTAGYTIRTPLDTYTPTAATPSFTFAGDSLTVNSGGVLLFKGVGSTGLLTFKNLVLDGGTIRHASGAADVMQLAGQLTVASPSTIAPDQGNITVRSAVTGSSDLAITSSAYEVRFLSGSNTFTGNLNVAGRFRLAEDAAYRFALGANGATNLIVGPAARVQLDGVFNFDLSHANLATGNTWTPITASNVAYGDSFSVNGFTYDAGLWRNGSGLVYSQATNTLSAVALPSVVDWTGNATGNLSDDGSWSASPASGNALRFGPTAGDTTLTDDRFTPGATTVAGITFAAGAPAYTINPATPGTNGVTLSAGVVNRSSNLQTINDAIALPFDRTNFVTNAGGGDLAIGGTVSGAGGIAKLGGGTLTLSGANTYTGGTRVEGGALVVTGSLASTNALTLGNSTFRYAPASGTTSQAINGVTVLAGASTIDNASTGNLSLGVITHRTGGTVQFVSSGGGAIGTSGANVNGIIGPWAFIGSGADTRYATNGGGTIAPYNGGTLETGTGAFGGIAAGDTSTVNYNVAASGTFAAMGSNRSVNTLIYTGAGATQPAANDAQLTVNGILNIGTGSLTIGAASPRIDVVIGNGLDLVVAPVTADVVLNNNVMDNPAGISGLTKAGVGTLSLNGANTYSGKTTVSAGTLAIGGGAALLDTGSVIVGPDGTLAVGASETIGSLAGSGTVQINGTSQTLTVGPANTSTTFAGTIAGASGILTKTGSGTLTLTGHNTYAGNTNISAGTLSVTSIADNTGTGSTINLGSGAGVGTLVYTGTGETTAKTIFQSAGAAANGATLDMSGTGLLRFTAPTLGANASQQHTLTLRGSTSGSGEIDGVISNGSTTNKTSVLKQGTGTWTLAGANTYTGATTVEAGTLVLRGSASSPVLSGAGGADIQSGRLVLDYTGGTTPATTVRTALAAGYALATPFSTGRLRSTTLATGQLLGWTDSGSTITIAATIGGDTNLDRSVNFSDLLALARNYGSTSGTWQAGDFNYDQSVNFTDLLALARNYGQSLSSVDATSIGSASFASDFALAQSLAPEPATLLSAIGLLTVAGRRRSR